MEDVKEQDRSALKSLRVQKARQAYIDSLAVKSEVAICLRPPNIQITYDPDRVRGDLQAPVTIVEFSDFQCPYCKRVEQTLQNLLAKYKGRVKIAYLDFPLQEIHPQAQIAAEAARCAGEHGKFWEFHDALFADRSKLGLEDLVALGRTLGIDDKSFRFCVLSDKYKSRIEADVRQGSKIGVSGTPAFLVNGVFLSGAQPAAEFEKIIDRQLTLLGEAPASR